LNTYGSTATCGDFQACIELEAGNGACAEYCDPGAGSQHGCPQGLACTSFHVGQSSNPSVDVCVLVHDGGFSFQVDGGGVQPDAGLDDGSNDVVVTFDGRM
jgi:hypothetical protein